MTRRIILVGAGGIGSWVAFLAPPDTKIYVFDDDIVEGSNLNRTPFLLEHIGMLKVFALKDLMKQYNIPVDIIPYPKRVSSDTQLPEADVLVDVTDKMAVRKMLARLAKKHNIPYVGLAYDGFRVTIYDYDTITKSYSTGAGGYTFVPSFVAPPVWLAAKFWKGELTPITKEL